MEWGELIKELLYAVITTVVPIIAYFLVRYLRSLSKKHQLDTEDSIISGTLSNAYEIIAKTVDTVSQTYVDTLKAEGKFDTEAQKKAFTKAKNTILTLLDDDSKEILKSLYTDINKWIEVQIEATIASKK